MDHQYEITTPHLWLPHHNPRFLPSKKIGIMIAVFKAWSTDGEYTICIDKKNKKNGQWNHSWTLVALFRQCHQYLCYGKVSATHLSLRAIVQRRSTCKIGTGGDPLWILRTIAFRSDGTKYNLVRLKKKGLEGDNEYRGLVTERLDDARCDSVNAVVTRCRSPSKALMITILTERMIDIGMGKETLVFWFWGMCPGREKTQKVTKATPTFVKLNTAEFKLQIQVTVLQVKRFLRRARLDGSK